MKTTWRHFTFEERKVIANCISRDMKLKEIGELLDYDPTSISKEVKRNRKPYRNLSYGECPKIKRWPHVCTTCKDRYKSCFCKMYKYDAKSAQKQADAKLIYSRRGIDLTPDEHREINNAISTGINQNKSLYHIKIENNIKQSIPTLYNYINTGILDKKRYDLPCACKYKKRKHNKQYDYSTSNKKIDRTGHSYIDYITFMKKHPWCNSWQMDFLGSNKTDPNSIHTIIMPEIQFSLLELIKKPNSQKVVEYFDHLEEILTPEVFIKMFEVILTDRDPCFADIKGLEYSKITGKRRTHVFYCDPYVSSQKANIENLNKQIRKFFPKGKSTSNYNRDYVFNTNTTIVNTPKMSLDGGTPKDAFINIFGLEIFNKILG